MSFLHGVLESVKDDESVKIYDNYIKLSNNNDGLDNVLRDVFSKIGTGRNGLSESVTKVKVWLGKYNGQVDSKTRGVTDGLSALIGVNNDFYQAVEREATNPLADQLAAWKQTLSKISSALSSDVKTEINKLDSALKGRIDVEMKPITKVIEHMSSVAGKMEEGGKVTAVDSAITSNEQHVRQQIDEKARLLQQNLGARFEAISGGIEKIEQKQTDDLAALMKNVNQLVTDVTLAQTYGNRLHTEYRSKILDKLEGIEGKVNGLGTTEIAGGLSSIFAMVSQQLDMLEIKLNNLKNTYLEVQEKVGPALSGIETELRKRIEALKEEIKNKIEDGPAMFATMVEKCIKEILKHNNIVKEKIDKYYDNITVQGKDQIATKIQEKLGEITRPAGEKVQQHIQEKVNDSKTPDKIEEYVKAVQAGCKQFADALDSKIREGTLASFAGGIVKEGIAKDSTLTGLHNKGDSAKHNLIWAVHLILEQLVGMTRKVASELQSFVLEPKLGENVKTAINRVTKLGEYLAEAVKVSHTGEIGQLGNQINTALGKQAISDVNDNKIKPLLKEAAKEGIRKLNDNMTSAIQTEMSRIDADIRPQINKLQKGQEGQENIQTQINKLQQQINQLISSVEDVNNKANGHVNQHIDLVKEQIARVLEDTKKINSEIKAFNASLQEAISTAKETVQQAKETLEKQISTDKEELTKAVKAAFTAVHTAAKQMFNQGHKADLEQLKKLVSEQSEEIRKLIEADKVKGLKGLLKEMYDRKGETLNDLTKHQDPKKPEDFKQLSEKLKDYLTLIFTYIKGQVKPPSSSPPNSTTKEPTKMLGEVQSKLVTLLENLGRSKHFDNVFVTHLASFSTELSKFTPSQFAGPENALLLDVLKQGLNKLRDQLDRAYVSAYSGEQINNNNKDKCAKILVTIFNTCRSDLKHLKENCHNIGWDSRKCYGNKKDTIGGFLTNCGYRVSQSSTEQDGEIRCDLDMSGDKIGKLLEKSIDQAKQNTHLQKCNPNGQSSNFSVLDILTCIYNHLRDYYTTCHLTLPASPKYPCNVRDMLSWLGGLPYTSVYSMVEMHCADLLKKEEKDAAKKSQKPDAVINDILKTNLRDSLDQTCDMSYRVLVTIQGHGHGFDQADYPYAVDISNNSVVSFIRQMFAAYLIWLLTYVGV
ncbi:hypothetical protein, conserved [Babesia ovata]|uniref:Extracellular matrix-binding ebh n=1 Tax=Babesia ovata TaxID=189622 RepID=A0A2H6KJE1_9APIC|nr:uncharacterized protein BOVATA_045990 [Babesia ovata]GBE63106.1 hypothetical protein, conserved [Babesia ovata]